MKTIEDVRRHDVTTKIVDEIIRFGSFGVFVSAGLLLPNLVQALDKPLHKLFAKMDERERAREIRRAVYYMKSRGYLAGDYEHGLQLTDKARRRLDRIRLSDVTIKPQDNWDKSWRIVIYDIPEKHAFARQNLTRQLRVIGCFQLQRSTWITPFPCREEISALCSQYHIDKYVTFFESHWLDNASGLLKRFQIKYPHTKF
jgi:DNA-binding transcriptional regulator PaaX